MDGSVDVDKEEGRFWQEIVGNGREIEWLRGELYCLPDFLLHDKCCLFLHTVIEVHSQRRIDRSELNWSRHCDDWS